MVVVELFVADFEAEIADALGEVARADVESVLAPAAIEVAQPQAREGVAAGRDPLAQTVGKPAREYLVPADTEEHPLADAVGGRLTASVLCHDHNGEANRCADEPFIAHNATLTWAAGVHRRRGNSAGKIGTTLRFTDREGRRTIVAPDGTSEYSGKIEEVSETGKPRRASGSLKALRAMRRSQPDPANVLLVEVISPGVTIPVGVGITLPCTSRRALSMRSTRRRSRRCARTSSKAGRSRSCRCRFASRSSIRTAWFATK